MAVEASRSCGYRKVGGLYLCGDTGVRMLCDRLPYELITCPVCGEGIRFSRGFRWVDWNKLAGIHQGEETEHQTPAKVTCKDPTACPVCYPKKDNQPYGLLFVGEKFYTPAGFIKESFQMGVSRRIPAVPKNLKLGKTWVLFAHIAACGEGKDETTGLPVNIPGVFYAFRPTRVELLIWKKDATPDRLEDLHKRGITPVIIPDGDKEHDPKTPLIPDKSVKVEAEDRVFFEDLRNRLYGPKVA